MLQDKVVLVTGAGSGVGRTTALACVGEGARVAVVDLETDSSEETVRQVREADGEATFIQADVTELGSDGSGGSQDGRNLRRLDCAFNNDLGCGAGLDLLLAAQKVGPSGKAIGIDMTGDMIQRARRNASQAGLTNVEFHVADIESLPMPDDSVDCVLSNCVLNLVPDKATTFAEIFRVLKPGGRLAVTDLALKQELPAEVATDFSAYVGCVAGAMLIADYEFCLATAGFETVHIVDSSQDLNTYARLDEPSCCQPSDGCETSSGETASAETSVHRGLAELLRKFDINEYVASVRGFALKPK